MSYAKKFGGGLLSASSCGSYMGPAGAVDGATGCAIANQTLRSIEGRTVDRFELPSGELVHGDTLGEVVEASGLEVRRFQITQERRDAFRVRLLLRSGERAFEQLEAALREWLEPGVGVSIEVVDALDHDGARKFYPFVSVERLKAWRAARSQG